MFAYRTLLAAAAASLALSIPLAAQDAPAIEIHDPYARAMGGIGKSGAVFFEIMNTAAMDDRLIDARADVAKKVELHTHKEDGNGIMQMLHVPEGFVVPAGGSHGLVRGADHVMLLGLTRDLAQGDSFPLTLVFEKAGEIIIDVPLDNDRKSPAMGGAMQGDGMQGGAMQGHKHGG